jgi:hypothetical protein
VGEPPAGAGKPPFTLRQPGGQDKRPFCGTRRDGRTRSRPSRPGGPGLRGPNGVSFREILAWIKGSTELLGGRITDDGIDGS